MLRFLQTFWAVALLGGLACAAPRPVPGAGAAPLPLAPATRYRVPAGDSPGLGPADARVVVVAFSDFECGPCNASVALLTQLQAEYGPQVRVVWKPLPTRAPEAQAAARAALAAAGQSRFWEMARALADDRSHRDASGLEARATALSLDLGAWRAALASPAVDRELADDLALAQALDLPYKPWFFVNGRSLAGPAKLADLEALVEEELARPGPPEGAEPRLLLDESGEPLSAEECPPPDPAGPALVYPGRALVQLCRGLYVDPAMPVGRATRAARDWAAARRHVAAALGPTPGPGPLVLVCETDACRRAFGGGTDSSLTVGLGGKLPGPASSPLPRAQVLMLDALVRFPRYVAHELVHADTYTRAPGAVPNWFTEGEATRVAGSPVCRARAAPPHPMQGLTTPEAWHALADGEHRTEAYCRARAEVEAWERARGPGAYAALLEQLARGVPFERAYGPLAAP